jgi:predicted nucleotidyltransferase
MTTIAQPSAGVAVALERAFAELPVPGVVSAYLFGSHAEGRSHGESDVDVGILLRHDAYPTRRDRFEARIRMSALIGSALRRDRIDVIVLNDAPPQLARRVVTSGRRVFCADGGIDHAFVRDSQLRAADIAPFLRRTRRRKLDALAG